MNFEISDNPLEKISSDAVLIFAFQGEGENSAPEPLSGFKDLDKKLSGLLSKALKIDEFSAKRGEVIKFYSQDILSPRVFILGLGKKKDFTLDDLRRAVGSFTKASKKKLRSLSLSAPLKSEVSEDLEKVAQVLAEGFLLGAYEFSKYRSKEEKNEKRLETVTFAQGQERDLLKKGIERAEIFAKATILARDLVNEQAFIATPTYLSNLASDIAKKDPKHIRCKIYDREEAEKLGMNAFLGVARGAETPPKFIVLEYISSKKTSEKLALVGKGIT
ncbi:MAG: M17 family peptidase N-terminal domain-containing protein, partial [Patescibacteria group bacterium]